MKFPYLTESRRFFFGLLEVTQWGWRCGLTKPQIDLMLHDQPVVDYKADKKKDGKIGYVRDDAERAMAEIEEMRQRGEDTLDALGIKGVEIRL